MKGVLFYDISIHVLREEDDQVRPAVRGRPEKFLSTSSARRTTPAPCPTRRAEKISIHVLREEDDSALLHQRAKSCCISIHVLREEDDQAAQFLLFPFCQFLSTSSARRTTRAAASAMTRRENFYPRPPRGGRHHVRLSLGLSSLFLSTSSARRTTNAIQAQLDLSGISIHVLREEDDSHKIGFCR